MTGTMAKRYRKRTEGDVQEQQALVGGDRMIRYGGGDGDGDDHDIGTGRGHQPGLAEPARHTATFTHSMDADVVEPTGYETDEAI